MEWMKQLTQKYVELPNERVYIHKDDVDRLRKGENTLAYLNIAGRSHSDYVLIEKNCFQPAIKIDDNTYDVVFILI